VSDEIALLRKKILSPEALKQQLFPACEDFIPTILLSTGNAEELCSFDSTVIAPVLDRSHYLLFYCGKSSLPSAKYAVFINV